MIRSFHPDTWPQSDFLFEAPPGAIRKPLSPAGFLFAARRFSLDVATLYRDTTWVSGESHARVQLSGLAKFCDGALTISGPESTHFTDLRSTWIRIQAATDRRDRIDYSTLEISSITQGSESAVHSELVLYVEETKLIELMQSLEASQGSLTVHFMLDYDDGISLSPQAPTLSVPVYDVVFSLQQAALAARGLQPLLPQLQHALENCCPLAVRGDTQLEIIGEEIALSLSQGVVGKAHHVDAEFAARTDWIRWLTDIRATFHGEAGPEVDEAGRLFSLNARDFEEAIRERDVMSQFALMKAYGRVWAHSPVRRARRELAQKPELDRYLLTPQADLLEALADRYCHQTTMFSPTLEWCLINALIRNSIVRLVQQPMQLRPKLRAAGVELSIQSVLAGCAYLFAQHDTLVFWMVFFALNFLRWMSPAMSPALAKKSAHAELIDDLQSAHEQLAHEDFNAPRLRDTLSALQARGATLPAVLHQLLEKRISRVEKYKKP